MPAPPNGPKRVPHNEQRGSGGKGAPPNPLARYAQKSPNGPPTKEPKGRATGTGHAGLLRPTEQKSPRKVRRPDAPSSEGAPRHYGPGVPPGKGRSIPVPVPPKKGASQKEWDWYKSAVWADKQARSRPNGKAFADMRAQAEKNAQNKPAAPKPSKAELPGDTVKLTNGVWRPGENPRVAWVRDALRKGGENARRDARRRGERLFDAPEKGGNYRARKTVEAAARPELATKEARKLRELRDAGVDVIHSSGPSSRFHHESGGVFGRLAASGRPTPQQIKKAEEEKPERAEKNARSKQRALRDVNEAHTGDVARGGVQYYGDEPNREEQLWKREDAHAPRRTNDFSEHSWESQGPSNSEAALKNRRAGRKGHLSFLEFRDRIQKELEDRKQGAAPASKPKKSTVPAPKPKPSNVAGKTLPRLGGGLGVVGTLLQILAGGDPVKDVLDAAPPGRLSNSGFRPGEY